MNAPSPVVPRRLPRPAPALLTLLIALLLGTAPTMQARAQTDDPQVHDPVMIKSGGKYYLFCTGRGIAAWVSDDMEVWSPLGRVFDRTPEWVRPLIPAFDGNIWAPDIIEHDGTFYLYYSVSAFGRNNSAIAVATNKTLDPESEDFAWVDHGIVIQSVPGRDMWNAIDAHLVFDEAATPWMSFGSHWNGIKLVKMNENLLEIAQPQQWRTVAARHRYWKLDERDAGDAANPELDYQEKYPAQIQDAALASENGSIEAPTIYKRGEYYYLFVSWDRCCRGVDSTYKVVVGRSRDITGPYLDRAGQELIFGGGTLVTLGFDESDRWAAGGHCDVVEFEGADYLVLHAYDKQDNGRPKLIAKPIDWDRHGWPTVDVSE